VDGANNDSACVVLDLSLTLTRHPCLCSVVVGTCSPEAPWWGVLHFMEGKMQQIHWFRLHMNLSVDATSLSPISRSLKKIYLVLIIILWSYWSLYLRGYLTGFSDSGTTACQVPPVHGSIIHNEWFPL
jgi:hypothetical protein